MFGLQKTRIRDTKHLSTDAVSSTDTKNLDLIDLIIVYRIAEWLEAEPLAERVRGSIPLFGLNVKSGKPF